MSASLCRSNEAQINFHLQQPNKRNIKTLLSSRFRANILAVTPTNLGRFANKHVQRMCAQELAAARAKGNGKGNVIQQLHRARQSVGERERDGTKAQSNTKAYKGSISEALELCL